jgi:hypothetical protein
MGGACLATAIRPSLRGQRAPSHALHSTFCVPHRRNRPASDPKIGETCSLPPRVVGLRLLQVPHSVPSMFPVNPRGDFEYLPELPKVGFQGKVTSG